MRMLNSHAEVCDDPNFTAKMRLRKDMNAMPTMSSVYIANRSTARSVADSHTSHSECRIANFR